MPTRRQANVGDRRGDKPTSLAGDDGGQRFTDVSAAAASDVPGTHEGQRARNERKAVFDSSRRRGFVVHGQGGECSTERERDLTESDESGRLGVHQLEA